jgi:hypothetical protein
MNSKLFLLSILLIASKTYHLAAAEDSQPTKAFPNQLQASPTPDDAPHPHVTSVPAARSGSTGSAMSPDNGSAMGLGISIPLGRPKKTPPEKTDDEGPSDESP